MKKALVVAVVVILLVVIGIGWLQQKKGEEKKPVQPGKEEAQKPKNEKLPQGSNVLRFSGKEQAPGVPQDNCGRVRLTIKL